MSAPSHRLARALHDAAVAAADPAPAVRAALARQPLPAGRVWLVALGKAAGAMGRAAVAALADDGRAPVGGLVVAPEIEPPPHPTVEVVMGDHPVPGTGSSHAARRLGLLTATVAPGDVVLVLLSGGASALVAAPAAEVEPADLVALWRALLASGADIAITNALRRRFTRWGGGRLAAALAPAQVRALAVSDVAGDDPAVIGSGPCSPDPLRAADLLALAEAPGLRAALPAPLRALLALAAHGAWPETPKPGDAAFARTTLEVVLDNRHALDATRTAADAAGADAVVVSDDLRGEARDAGRACARTLLDRARERAGGAGARPLVLLWGGETTVTLDAPDAAPGGRCQELALAAAAELDAAPAAGPPVALLAAGTDGRDGPTDAAGALVDARTWRRIRAAGRDPDADLAAHASHAALGAAGALLRTGLTGTNVRDVVIGVVGVG